MARTVRVRGAGIEIHVVAETLRKLPSMQRRELGTSGQGAPQKHRRCPRFQSAEAQSKNNPAAFSNFDQHQIINTRRLLYLSG
ncbi:MAG: hypothetical protein OEL20_07655 [Sulfuritalea sp.]|nr:hypothetical protein [Sulfuritalea sp.]